MAEPGEAVAPTNGVSTLAAQRAATLAALEANEHVEKPAAPVVEKSAEVEPEAEDTDSDAPVDEGPAPAVEEDDEDEEEAKAEPEKPAEKPDPDLTKRLAQVQKAERRARETIAKERADAKAELEQAKAHIEREWGPRVQAAQEFEALKKRAKYEPDAVLRSLGLDDAGLEAAARVIFSDTEAGKKNPQYREQALKLQREREQADKLAANEKQIAEMRAERAAEKQAAELAHHKTLYLDDAIKTGAEAPLLKQLHAKSPAKARAQLWTASEQLFGETGEMPTADEAVERFEKNRREYLEEMDIEVPKAAAKAEAVEAKKVAAKVAAKKEAAPKTLKEQREETRRLLEEGKFD